MIQINQIYKCSVCGNIVRVLHSGGGVMSCCGKPMEEIIAKSKDEGMEKHVPVITKTDSGITINVGSIPHPMEEAHFIEWIELFVGEKSYLAFLKPGDKPQAEFKIATNNENIWARIYCNIHGLWKSE